MLTRDGESSKEMTQVEGDDNLVELEESYKLIPVEVFSMQQSRGGTYIQLDFSTTAPAATMTCLSKTYIEPVPDGSGGWTVSGDVERFAFSNTNNDHSVVVKDLDPGSVYYIVILLNPPPKYEVAGWRPYHWFEITKKRRVTVSIPFIYVIDDSDELSAGDLAFRFQIGSPSADFWQPGNSWDHVELPAVGDIQIDSGDGFWPGSSMHADDVGNAVKLTASCIDTDSIYAGGYNTPDKYMGSGSNDVAEWNSGAWTYNVAGGTEMSPGLTLADREEFEFGFVETVYEQEDTCLEYQVWGGISVSYE